MTDQADDAADEELAARASGAGLPQPGTIVANRYRIDREIGSGGMAVVYAATQLGAGSRQVALKWMFQGRSNRDERRRRFLREARAAGSIQHPNVVRVYDAGEHESGVYLVMELVVGESLTSYLQQRGKLSPRDAIDLMMPGLRGVAAANKQGVIHRDLKPDNLIVCGADRGKPELKVLDFGLSKLVGPAADSLHTLPGTLVGTPQYMAPEQADGRIGTVSERSDVYTLAAILYEALTGRRPFESETLAGHLMKLSREEPTRLHDVADVPDDLADMIMWALARDPLQRPRDVEELARGLEPFGTAKFSVHPSTSEVARASVRAPKATPKSVSPPPAETSGASKTKASSRTGLLIGVGVAALLLVALALRGGDDEAREQPAASSAPTSVIEHAPKPEPEQAPALVPAPADAGVAPAEPSPPPEAQPELRRTRSTTTARPDPPREPPAPQPAAAPVESGEPPAAPARRKRSPGVADPWDEQ
jgi:serine/threonine protein kinase